MRFALLSFVAGAFLIAVPAYAHHSFAATYQEQESTTVDGKVTEFLFRNPHCLFTLETTDANGTVTTWTAEWGGAGRVGAQGVTADTFKPGDHVIITGAPGINPGDHRIHLKTIVRPADGLKIERLPGGYRRESTR
jgi:hypothetical protein